MTMTAMSENLNTPVSGKAVFMEFGPPSQQMSPPMSHGHYSMHCLHSAGHSQHDSSYNNVSSFSRSLGYPYVNSVNNHSANPYISSVQSYQSNSNLAHTRLEDTGKTRRISQPLNLICCKIRGRRYVTAASSQPSEKICSTELRIILPLIFVIIYCVTP